MTNDNYPSPVSRAHMRSWLVWTLFNEGSTEALSNEQCEVVECALNMMERRAGMMLGTDDNEGVSNQGSSEQSDQNRQAQSKHLQREQKQLHNIKPLRLTLDPMSVSSRPIIAYAVINAAGLFAYRWFEWRYVGVKYETVGGITYVCVSFLITYYCFFISLDRVLSRSSFLIALFA